MVKARVGWNRSPLKRNVRRLPLVKQLFGTEPDGCREKKIMNTVTIVLRFIFGVVVAGSLALWGGIPFLLGVICVVAVGIVAAVCGDKFLLGFMSVMRNLR
jgi:hypothetical protein